MGSSLHLLACTFYYQLLTHCNVNAAFVCASAQDVQLILKLQDSLSWNAARKKTKACVTVVEVSE